MSSRPTKSKALNHRLMAGMTLLIAASQSSNVAFGQAMATNSHGYSGGGVESIAYDQESLLPPEVIPVDAKAAAANTSKQTNTGSLTANESAVPGLVNNQFAGMQSAQDLRKSAFEALYGQGQLMQQPVNNNQYMSAQNSTPIESAEISRNSYAPNQQAYAPMNQPNMMNQSNMMNQPNTMNAPYNNAQAMPPHSQMLAGGVRNAPVTHDIRRAGFSNALSAIAGFGAGALTSAAILRPQNALYGMGLYGTTMSGFGVRNGFRF